MNETNDAPQSERIECPPARDPAVRLFIIAAMLLLFGGWCFYEHYIAGNYQKPTDPDASVNLWAGYFLNAWGAIVFTLGGLIPLFLGIRFLRRIVVADARGINYPGQGDLAWKDVKKLDADDLADKGILRLEYGSDKTLVLDSWKLQNFKALVAFVESHVPAEAVETRQQKQQTDD